MRSNKRLNCSCRNYSYRRLLDLRIRLSKMKRLGFPSRYSLADWMTCYR
nr:MAG TPA: hypothetical protein [Caudoviricetes sp.]